MSEKERQDYILQIDNDFNSVMNKRVIEISHIFDTNFENNDAESTINTLEEALSLLEQDFNAPTKIQLCYNIATAYSDLRKITDEINMEKEIYYFRYALDIYEKRFYLYHDEYNTAEERIANFIATKVYTNLGNSMREVGRYITAIDCFHNALAIDLTFAMASLNLSFTLFRYGQLQIKPYEQQYYYHRCYHYYKWTETLKENLEKQEYLMRLAKTLSIFHPDFVEDYLNKELSLPRFDVDNKIEANYRTHISVNRLFLEPCSDIISNNCFNVDSINLPLSTGSNLKNKEFVGLFNQIKQEYNTARYLWYETTVLRDPIETDLTKHISDKELDFIDLGDTADYSHRENLLRVSFKAAYSIFGRIAFFINEYFSIGLTGFRISFKNIWKDDVPNPIIKAFEHNPLVKAMYWLQKDFYEDNAINITNPNAEPIFKMRNDMEHNCIRTVEFLPFNKEIYSFTKFTTEYEIKNNTSKLLKLLREIIIYLCLAVNFEECKNTLKDEVNV